MIPKLTWSTAPPTLGDALDVQKAIAGDKQALLNVLMRRTGAAEADLRHIELGEELGLVLEQLKTSLQSASAQAVSDTQHKSVQ